MDWKVCILRDHNPDNSFKWELACQKYQAKYKAINLLKSDWLQEIRLFNPDFCVCRPPGDVLVNKEVFDKRLYFLGKN
jgi:hypothetical protein